MTPFRPQGTARAVTALAAATTALALAGCATTGPWPEARGDGTTPGAEWSRDGQRSGHGTVTRVERIRIAEADRNPGAGAVVGGTLGAVIGRRIGESSDARAAGAVVGAVIGAIAGHHLEKEFRSTREVLRITVQLDRGGEVVVEDEPGADFRPGDRVRVENQRAVRVADERRRRVDPRGPLLV